MDVLQVSFANGLLFNTYSLSLFERDPQPHFYLRRYIYMVLIVTTMNSVKRIPFRSINSECGYILVLFVTCLTKLHNFIFIWNCISAFSFWVYVPCAWYYYYYYFFFPFKFSIFFYCFIFIILFVLLNLLLLLQFQLPFFNHHPILFFYYRFEKCRLPILFR